MNDRNAPEGAFSDRDPFLPKPTPTPANEDAKPNDLPSLAKQDGGSSLSSLAQSARLKQLNTARMLLFFVGIVQVGFSTYELVSFDGSIQEEMRKANVIQLAPADAARIGLIKNIIFGFLGAGVAYLVLGALVKTYPLPCTILGLCIFLLVQGIAFAINPAGIAQGLIMKIFFLASFISAIKAAKAYQDEEVAAQPVG